MSLGLSANPLGRGTGSGSGGGGSANAVTAASGAASSGLFWVSNGADRSAIATDTVTTLNTTTATANKIIVTPSTLTYATTTNIDFDSNGIRDLTLTGNVTFTTSNLGAGKSVTVRMLASGGTRNFTAFPAWIFIGAASPASLASGKYAVLTLTSWSTTDANVVAAYSAQP